MASGTAEGVAYMRYFESARPMEQRICNDYMAYHLMAWWVKAAAWLTKPFSLSFMDRAFEKKGRGITGFMAVRTRLFDDYGRCFADAQHDTLGVLRGCRVMPINYSALPNLPVGVPLGKVWPRPAVG